MTVSNTNTKLQYSGDGSNRTFAITFPLLSAAHLRVIATDSDGVETEVSAHYTLSPALDAITYPTVESGLTPLPAGRKITLLRQTPLTQALDLQSGNILDAEELERGYDKLTYIVQELKEQLARALKYSVSKTDEHTAEAYLEEINKGVVSSAGYAESAETSAGAAASSAASSATFAAEAADSKTAAAASAAQAQSAQTAAETAKTAAQEWAIAAASAGDEAQAYASDAAATLEEIKTLKRERKTYTAGTASGTYDGNLTSFDTGLTLTNADVVAFVNGQRKDAGEYSVSGQKVVFAYSLTAGDVVVLEINDIVRTAGTADVDGAISTHNASTTAHADIRTALAAKQDTLPSGTAGKFLKKTATGVEWAEVSGGSAEQYVVATSTTVTASYLNSAQKSKFRSSNLGISGKTITRVEYVLGSGAAGSPLIVFPCMTGWGNQSGNFVDIYYEWPLGSWVFTDWFTDTSAIPAAIRVYYK